MESDYDILLWDPEAEGFLAIVNIAPGKLEAELTANEKFVIYE